MAPLFGDSDEVDAPLHGDVKPVVQRESGGFGDPDRARASSHRANLPTVEKEFDPTGQRSRNRWAGDEDEPASRRRGGCVLGRSVEVDPFGEASSRGFAGFVAATDLAERAMQPIAMIVRRELVVEVEIEPVATQANDGLANRRPDRDQDTELAAHT